MSSEKIINKRIFGFVFCFVIMLIFSLFWYLLDETILVIICGLISLLQIAFIIITPYCYIFSEEYLIIKYCLGSEENIPWLHIWTIIKLHENAFKYTPIATFKIYYYSKEKLPFYMQGIISKNKMTTALMKKYCKKDLIDS